MPITILDVTEAGCMGVAMLAKAYATGENVGKIASDMGKTCIQGRTKA